MILSAEYLLWMPFSLISFFFLPLFFFVDISLFISLRYSFGFVEILVLLISFDLNIFSSFSFGDIRHSSNLSHFLSSYIGLSGIKKLLFSSFEEFRIYGDKEFNGSELKKVSGDEKLSR